MRGINNKRWGVFGLGAMLSLVFLWLALRNLHIAEVWHGIRTANYGWVLPGVAIYFLSVWVRAWRWAYLLRASKPISGNSLFSVITIGYMGNDIFPFRLGEVLRAYILWKREQVNFGTTFTTALAERLFDGLTMVLFVLIGLLFVPLTALVQQLVIVASVVFVLALIAFLLLAAQPRLLQQLATWFIARLIPPRFRPVVQSLVAGVIAGLEVFRSLRDVLITFGFTLVVWLLETGKYWFVSQAFGLHLTYPVILLMGGAVNLLTALPSLPGYVGTFELGITILTSIGVAAGPAGSYVLVLHALLWFPVVAVALVFFAREGLSWTEVKVAVGERGR